MELTKTFSGLSGRMVTPPLGSKAIEVFDLQGKKVWERDLDPTTQETLALPGSEAEMFWVRYR